VLNDAIGAVEASSPPSLVAGANPPAQYAAAGTTSLTFSFPAATGGVGLITYSPPALTAPPGSGASVSGTAPGNITVNDAVDGESYLIRVYATDADGQQVLNDAIGAVEASSPPVLVAGANPPDQYAAAGTASLTFAFPAASGGTPPYVYSAPTLGKPTGSGATASGTAPGNITINNTANGEAYLLRVVVTDADGQQVLNDALGDVSINVTNAWTQVGGVNFIGAVAQTFTTTGNKVVTLADASTVTVNASTSVGLITAGIAGVDPVRGLIADVPPAAGNVAYRLRTTVPVSPAIAATDDVLVAIRWRVSQDTGTAQRALAGLTSSAGSEASAEFSGFVFQNSVGNNVKLQSRKGASVADMVAALPAGWRDGSVLVQSEVRVVAKFRTTFSSVSPRNVNTGTPTYQADIGSDSSGPSTGLEAPLFSGAAVYVQLYSWNGAASPYCYTAIEQILVYSRPTSRVP
jgi:hypothetical protein